MIMGHDRRIIMGPAWNRKVFGIVGLVPDEFMNEDASKKSWTTDCRWTKLLETFSVFPDWVKGIFTLRAILRSVAVARHQPITDLGKRMDDHHWRCKPRRAANSRPRRQLELRRR
jgi:hypothetical protein